jgi:hypothetical protein
VCPARDSTCLTRLAPLLLLGLPAQLRSRRLTGTFFVSSRSDDGG